jgi:hypothetical protein
MCVHSCGLAAQRDQVGLPSGRGDNIHHLVEVLLGEHGPHGVLETAILQNEPFGVCVCVGRQTMCDSRCVYYTLRPPLLGITVTALVQHRSVMRCAPSRCGAGRARPHLMPLLCHTCVRINNTHTHRHHDNRASLCPTPTDGSRFSQSRASKCLNSFCLSHMTCPDVASVPHVMMTTAF